MVEKLILVKTLADLTKLEDYLKPFEYIAYDCETTGLDKDAEVIGFSVCADVEVAYYVVLAYWDVQEAKLKYLETQDGAAGFLNKLVGKPLVMHNAVFDCWKAETAFSTKLMPSLHTDTMILAHLLDENRRIGLKDLAVSVFGEESTEEQREMRASVYANGGVLTKEKYELYKADADLIGKYGAKDTILTLKLFYHLVPELYEQGLEKFFYEEESMPLLRGPTYDLNTSGLKVDLDALSRLKFTLEAECLEAKAFIHAEIAKPTKAKYPGTSKAKTFNIGSSKQLAWLLFFELGNEFHTLTKGGRELCKALSMPVPYSFKAKRDFISTVRESKGKVYEGAKYNPKTKKMTRPKKVGDPWNYIGCNKEALGKYADKYKWVAKYLEYAKALKLLNTYVARLQNKTKYGIFYPNFKQAGTTSGRYSSDFQNLPRDDKRIKACIIARPGKVIVGADYSQLEPRVFASMSQDAKLMKCFKDGDDFYSVIGVETFEKHGASLKKDDKDSFAKLYPKLRDDSKVVGLSATYGTTAFKMASTIRRSVDETQDVIDSYFNKFPAVYAFMLERHETVKREGRVESLFKRPRRLPEALKIKKQYGNSSHSELPYAVRNLLNLAVNHTVQSTGASTMNRAAIAAWNKCRELEMVDKEWANVKIIMQCHDELEMEGAERLGDEMVKVLQDAMQNTVQLPGVDLIAVPKIGKSLADIK